MTSKGPKDITKVFISYSQDSPEHCEQVLSLSNRLCKEGIDCNIDRYEISPVEGWPQWMEKQIDLADFVLVVCTKNYTKRFKGQETEKGHGVKWEGTILTHKLYEMGAKNESFIPVLFSSKDVRYIPLVLKGATYYKLDSEKGYKDLYARLTDQRNITKPKIGKVKKLSSVKKENLQKPITKDENFEKRDHSINSQYPQEPIFNVPYGRNYFFTGRKEILDQLHEELKSSNVVALSQPMAICGLGGIGKTQTAIEYTYRYRNEYMSVFWVKADSVDSIVSDYVATAKLLSLPLKGNSDQNLVVTSVKNWLKSNCSWLLILDNADDPNLIENFLPSHYQGHILLTSRSQSFDNLGITNPIEIKKMKPEEAKNFLLKRTGRTNLHQNELKALGKLVCELDYLPLALEQAGAYISENKSSFEDYLVSYNINGLNLLAKSPIDKKKYPNSVSTTWLMNFEEVRKKSKISEDILFSSAFLNPHKIPAEIYYKGANELGPFISAKFNQNGEDPLIFDEVLTPLRQYSLINRDPGCHTYDVHRLVQAVLRDGMDERVQRYWAENVIKALNLAFPEVDYKNWDLCDKLLPHARICQKYIESWAIETKESAKLLNKTGMYLHKRARFKESELFLKSSLEIRSKILGPENLDTSESLNSLGGLYKDLGRYSEAEQLHLHALEIRERAFGPEHPDVGVLLINLAGIYYHVGRYSEAESLYQRALNVTEKILGSEHPNVASCLSNLAVIYSNLGRDIEAELLQKRALEITEKALGPEHPDVGTRLNNLALTYSDLGRYSEAEPLYRRALEITKKALGPEHPNVGIRLNNLAGVYRDLGQLNEAEPLQKRALEIIEITLGSEHPAYGTCLNNLALNYVYLKRYSEAEPLYRHALEITEKALGLEHPDLYNCFNNLAMVLHKQEKYYQANPYYEQAVKIMEETKGKNSFDLVPLLKHYAFSLTKVKRNREATKIYNRIKNILSQVELDKK